MLSLAETHIYMNIRALEKFSSIDVREGFLAAWDEVFGQDSGDEGQAGSDDSEPESGEESEGEEKGSDSDEE